MRSLLVSLLLLVSCGEPPTAARPAPMAVPEPEPADQQPHWVTRTDLELDEVLRSECRASVEEGKPLLLEFSAPWCVDCRRLIELSKDPAVASELSQFRTLTVDVGRWDRHKPLVEAFGVGVLAWWVALAPTDCDAPPPTWPRLKEGGFEPASGSSGVRTASGVAAWLSEARTSGG